MNKIICDVCGTSYPETATQCPICGFVRSEQGLSDSGESTRTYTHVKGGRFSKANVRKRNKAGLTNAGEEYEYQYDDTETPQPPSEEPARSGVGLVVTAIFLLLAIVAVVIYIALRFFMPWQSGETEPQNTKSSVETTAAADQIACNGIQLEIQQFTLDAVGAVRMLYVSLEPADTTDELVCTSSNTGVVTAVPSTDGCKITAVGEGDAVVTVICGNVSAQCTILCRFDGEDVDATDPTDDTTAPAGEILFNRTTDFTLLFKGEQWKLYTGTIPAEQVTFTSDNESVVTFNNGIVTAVGEGSTEVHAEYGEQKLSCKVICNFSNSSGQGVGGSGNVTEDGDGSGGNTATGSTRYRISSQYGEINYGGVAEATISVGEVLQLSLTDDSGKTVSTDFTVNGSSCTVSGNSVTGVSSGSVEITFVYNSTEYTCKIIVY